ncbi:hypothetical protein ACQPZX_24660 [Actinoplanes sp. CA-142083]|uniref:hypothetical protein n=1 Tax=Actinoplanes sp. CA-142083 TaxID=3239903 RepID=UPI003D8E00DE
MRDDISSGILDAPPGAPRACVFGEIEQAGFRDAFCVLVDDDGKLEYQVERGAGSVEVDRDLALIARHALDRLIVNPGSRLHNGLFRAAVWAATAAPVRTQTSGLLWVATFDASGDDANRVPDLASLLPGDRHLAAALARMLASPVDLAAQRAFDEATGAAAARAGVPAPRLDLTRTVLTAAGVTSALLGDADTTRTATIAEIAVTGLWPEDGDPLGGNPPTTPVPWQGLEWQLIR